VSRAAAGEERAIVQLDPGDGTAEAICPARALLRALGWINIIEAAHERRTGYLRQPQRTGWPPPSPDPLPGRWASQTDPAPSRHVHALLTGCNVPPPSSKTLLRGNSDIRLVFHSHPTEIVAGINRCAQTTPGVASLIQKLQQDSPAELHDKRNLRLQLEEGFGIWWRTDLNSTSSSLGARMRWITPCTTSSKVALRMPCPVAPAHSTAP